MVGSAVREHVGEERGVVGHDPVHAEVEEPLHHLSIVHDPRVEPHAEALDVRDDLSPPRLRFMAGPVPSTASDEFGEFSFTNCTARP